MKITLKDYLPIIYIYLFSFFVSLTLWIYYSYSFRYSLLIFLGSFSLVFSVLKFYNYKGFIESFMEYDFISKKIRFYAYSFPFFEFAFGIAFVLRAEVFLLEIFCLLFFSLNLLSVLNALLKKQKYMCACLGGLFNVPLSYVSLFENLTMIGGILLLIILG